MNTVQGSKGHCRWERKDYPGQVFSVAFAPDGKTIAAGPWGQPVELINAEDGALLRKLEKSTLNAQTLAFSPDGGIISFSGQRALTLYATSSGRLMKRLEAHSEPITAIAFHPAGQTVVSGGDDGVLRLWDIAAGKILRVFSGCDRVVAAAFSPDGKTLAASGMDSDSRGIGINLLDPEDKDFFAEPRMNLSIEECYEPQRSVVFSPTGGTIASASGEGDVWLWDLARAEKRWISFSRKELRSLAGHTGMVLSLAFSPDGRMLASASTDRTVKVWDTTTGTPLATLSGHSHWVNSVAFSPDGKTLVSAGDGVRLWAME